MLVLKNYGFFKKIKKNKKIIINYNKQWRLNQCLVI